MTTVFSPARTLATCVTLVLLSGCAREAQDQMSWARAALERNAQIEVVAADPQSHTFTVRIKDTGELRTVRADQVVAGPLSAAAPALAAAPAAPEPQPQANSAAAPAPPAPPVTDESTAAAPPAAAPSGMTAPATAARAHGAQVLEAGPGYSIESSTGGQPALMQSQSGPGYSIKTAPGTAAAERGRLRDAGVTSAAVERRREPIVCQGSRLLHIDNRNLEFDGDAVSAQDGCEIHITNSHISATGIGVLARNANVHIDNSLIEGDGGSIDASEGAQVYVEDSHFRGLSRRLDSAAFHDLGGNIWN
jgi:hypothetical protein